MSDWKYFQVIERFESNDFDVSPYEILIDDSSLNGEPISGACLSADGNWVCVPVRNEEAELMTGQYEYRPQCFEVRGVFSMWVSNQSMAYRVEVRLLRA